MKLLNLAIIAGTLFLNTLIHTLPAFAAEDSGHIAGVCYKLVDRDGRVISLTSRRPVKGDEIIKPDGYLA